MHCKSASSESKYIRPGDPEIWFGRVYRRRSPSGIQGKAPLVMGSTTEADDVLLKKIAKSGGKMRHSQALKMVKHVGLIVP